MSDRPNLLILISDQHSRHYLGCYGDPLVRTPHLDRLAAEGMRFDQAYCAAPLCVPSRMSFMTGRTPTANRVWNNSHILNSAIPTWAHAMGAAGCETALIGRMHFMGPDQRHGFERRPLGEYSATFPGVPWIDRQNAFHQIPASTSGQQRIAVELAGAGRTTYQAFDEMVAQATCPYLEGKAVPGQRPFAAVAGFLLPHCPFFAPRDLFDYYYERVELPPVEPSVPLAIQRFQERRGLIAPLPEERIRVARAAYYGMCEFFDRQIGLILDALERTGLAQNTLVVYCSDHGEMAGEHGCWWKSNFYEGSVGVPLIARLPGTVPAGAVNGRICNLMDLGPTGVDMAGGEEMPDAAGRSLWTELRGERDPTRPDETFSENYGTGGDPPARMIRRERWKLYKYHDDTPPVLYDLAADPEEMHDLGQNPAHAAVREELLERLCRDWDPEFTVAESARLERDMRLLRQWGEKVRPRHGDSLPVPDAEKVELL